MKFANSKEFMAQLEEVNDYFILESVVKALDITSHNFEVADTFVEMYKDEFITEDYLVPKYCVKNFLNTMNDTMESVYLVPKYCVENFLITLNDTMESVY